MTHRELLEALVDRADEVILSLARGEDVRVQLEKRNSLARIVKYTKKALSPKEDS